jgi:site-specific recombinase XerD
MRRIIPEWTKNAGINKHITFHSSRHTFAVMMLDLGVDIYTVSKMLGHKDIKTTQIYAELLDKRKQEAVLKIPEI